MSFVSATYIPGQCEDDEIKATWDSIFEENSNNIIIFTNNSVTKDRCEEYFAYEIKGNLLWFLIGTETSEENKTKIIITRINATQEIIDIIEGFNNINETRIIRNIDVMDYTQPRNQTLNENQLNQEFNSIYRELPEEWIRDSNIATSNKNDTVYYFFKEEFFDPYKLTKTSYITNYSNYITLTLLYQHLEIEEGDNKCTANFSCGNWSDCISGNLTRTCLDLNGCGPQKTENQPCTCIQNWNCGQWATCINNIQIRNCFDTNNCQNESNKPDISKVCGTMCYPNWNCTDWIPEKCDKLKTQYRNCTDKNFCNSSAGMPETTKSCTYIPNFAWMIALIILLIIILILGNIGIIRERLKKKKEKFGSPTQTIPKTPPTTPPLQSPSIITIPKIKIQQKPIRILRGNRSKPL